MNLPVKPIDSWSRGIQRQHECSSKANRQLVKRNPPSSSAGTNIRIFSPNTFTRNGSQLNNYETRDASKPNFSSHNLCALLVNAPLSHHTSCSPCSPPFRVADPTLISCPYLPHWLVGPFLIFLLGRSHSIPAPVYSLIQALLHKPAGARTMSSRLQSA
ncbi:unnamed protein product [Protopolystoma xenopodis]|uniref:Uncharacterized protein n=1 Tax=Protopolystoma xenopodis TaxID=117903 RepID=A0A448X356_9PLAT|nr:unnamed protein product [Protopolystoma xenopodis]